MHALSVEPVIYREEAVATMFVVRDILEELRTIRRLLEGEDGEEVQEDLDE
jgi:hypothetical protein